MEKKTTKAADQIIGKKKSTRALWIAGVAGLALAIAVPLVSPQADASQMSEGQFCIQASSNSGEFTGRAGAQDCGEAKPATATTRVEVLGNLSSSASVGEELISAAQVVAPDGTGWTFRLTFTRTPAGWMVTNSDGPIVDLVFIGGVQPSSSQMLVANFEGLITVDLSSITSYAEASEITMVAS